MYIINERESSKPCPMLCSAVYQVANKASTLAFRFIETYRRELGLGHFLLEA